MPYEKKLISLTLLILTLILVLFNISSYEAFCKERKCSVELETLSNFLKKSETIRLENEAFLSSFKPSHPTYIHAELESIRLTSGSKIEFEEKEIKKHPYYSEGLEKLITRPLIDFEEVKLILEKIETPKAKGTLSPPHLIISDFTLKKNSSLHDNLFQIDLELLKREYPP